YNLITNNFISVGSNTSAATGINYAGYNTRIYYNSINMYGKSSSSLAMNLTYSTQNAEIKNNSIANNAGGVALKCLYGGNQILSSDYNNFYSSGDFITHWLGTNDSTLTDWQLASGFDSNSVSSYPNFIAESDLHTSNILLNNAGTPVAEVTTDIDGETRDATNPDIGADEFTAVTFSLGKDVTVCVDATYKIDAGVGFDTYLWSNGASSSDILVDSTGIGYGSKEYYVTVTLDGNSYSDSIVVSFSSPIAMQQDYYCKPVTVDSVLLTAGDGVEYKWSTGETTQSIWLSASYVYVTVTDANGCQSTEYISRLSFGCPANFDMPDDTTLCNNDSIVLDANSVNCYASYSHYSYLWNTGDTTETLTVYPDDILSAYKEYTVEITFSSYGQFCITYDTVHVYKNNCPANLNMPDDTTIYQGEVLILDANSTSCGADYSNYSYVWNTGETTETIAVDASSLGTGIYSYSVSVTNMSTTSNCITTDMVNVNVNTSIDSKSIKNERISIYPNPTDGIVKLEFNNPVENTWIKIINVTGQLVYSEYLENVTSIKTLDLSAFDKGIYILSVGTKNTISTTKITLF
ncbi:T9SS type A sorting domain-containing protein, partial [Bacteroidota bacterium]